MLNLSSKVMKMTIDLFWVVAFWFSFIAYVLVKDLNRVLKKYTVTHNGYYWVVRDNKGRFVRITRNFWDILSLGVDNNEY